MGGASVDGQLGEGGEGEIHEQHPSDVVIMSHNRQQCGFVEKTGVKVSIRAAGHTNCFRRNFDFLS